MQFCPRCGTQNQDSRAACWKCFSQLQKSDSKKPQLIVMKDRDVPASGIHASPEPEVEVTSAAAVPIPELAADEPVIGPELVTEPEPVVPVFQLDEPAPEPMPVEPLQVEEPAPAVASLGDVLLPSPTFDSAPVDDGDEPPTQPVPILGLIHTETEPDPEALAIDEPEEPMISFGGLSEAPREIASADDEPAAEESDESAIPWWMAQDENEDASTDDTAGGATIDLDDGLEYVSLDDDSGPASPDGEDDDSKQPPGA